MGPLLAPRLSAKRASLNSFGIAARLIFALLCLITSIYCMLAYLPDIYISFIQAPLYQWLAVLMRLHPYIFATVVLFLSLATLLERRVGRGRRMAFEFVGVQAAVAVFFLWKKPFSHLGNDSLSLLWSFAILFPVLWLGILDWDTEPQIEQTEGINRELHFPFLVAAQAGLAFGILFPGMLWLSWTLAGRRALLSGTDLLAWAWTIGIQILFAIFAVALLNLARSMGSRVRAGRWQTLYFSAFAAVALAWFCKRVLLPSIPFAGRDADFYSAALSATIVGFCVGLWRRIHAFRSQLPAGSDASPAGKSGFENRALILVLMIAMYVVPSYIGVMDWNFVLTKLWAAVLWLAIAALLMRCSSARTATRYPVLLLLILCLSTFVASRFTQPESSWMRALKNQHPAWADAIDRRISLDASFVTVSALWAETGHKSCDEFCQFLHEQTNIPAYIPVRPVDIKLVDRLNPAPGPKPNIFIVVVDSLRRDYLSPYNPAVQFTPHIGEFAAESVVMRNSFTRYGGTSLSEAAIWSGSLMLHKQFVQPFHPMNNLEKLLAVNNYDRYVSLDPILRPLIEQPPSLHQLDSSVTYWADQDFCRTAVEAEQKIDQRPDKSDPIFVYTQPQNVHLVALWHASSVRPPDPGKYPGFQPSAATELRRFDACFGNFISYLKSRGLYDNSIVVLTADHGEAYGEFGHISHAYGLYPSTLRIPLIIHLPQGLRDRYYYDPQAVAFNIDVTPSLYYLLGYRPVANDDKFGRPLFTQTPQEHEAYQRKSFLVSVCYNPIYGILAGDGKTLFIANEVNGEYQYFDLVHDPEGTVNLIDNQIRAQGQKQIRGYVQDLADYYHYRYDTPTLLSWALR